MTERCKRNPCCGDLLDCKPPPQFKPRESYEEYQRRSALSPAATPVSEAETVAWQTVSDFVDEMLRDWSGGDDCRMGFGVNGATVTKGQFRSVRSALASLSPAATPVSEAGGEAAERSWRRTKFEFIGAMRQALINSGLTREQVIIADNAITEAFSDLAKPTFSPAGGDVVEALKRIAEHPEKYDDGVQSYDVGFAFWNVQKIARNALAALVSGSREDGE